MTTDARLQYLFTHYFNRTSSPDEEGELMRLIHQSEHDRQLRSLMDEVWQQLSDSPRLDEEQSDRILANLARQRTHAPVGKGKWISVKAGRRLAAASVILLILSGAAYWLSVQTSKKQNVQQQTIAQRYKNDIAPGRNNAVLVLADGTTIVLDSARTGTLTQQGGVNIRKPRNGSLAYDSDSPGTAGTGGILYNTIATPRGGQYELELADGSKVWLNAGSSLRFPNRFEGGERMVELTGEAYFEITKKSEMPFKVKVHEAEVMVLGTQFNVNAYEDEATMKTTLLEGAVSVSSKPSFSTPSSGQLPLLLKPGQQAQLTKTGQLKLVSHLNLDLVTAWKNGRFEFDDNSIESVMRQITRWYNVEVVYEGSIPDISFVGAISRQENISQVLKMLELTHLVRFRIEDRKIVVMPLSY